MQSEVHGCWSMFFMSSFAQAVQDDWLLVKLPTLFNKWPGSFRALKYDSLQHNLSNYLSDFSHLKFPWADLEFDVRGTSRVTRAGAKKGPIHAEMLCAMLLLGGQRGGQGKGWPGHLWPSVDPPQTSQVKDSLWTKTCPHHVQLMGQFFQ